MDKVQPAPYQVVHKTRPHKQPYYRNVHTIIGPDEEEVSSMTGGAGDLIYDECARLNEAYAIGMSQNPDNLKVASAYAATVANLKDQLARVRKSWRYCSAAAIRLGAKYCGNNVLVTDEDTVYQTNDCGTHSRLVREVPDGCLFRYFATEDEAQEFYREERGDGLYKEQP